MIEKKKSGKKCDFCDINSKHADIINDLLRKKYFFAFNFYLAKPINEMINNIKLPHVILFKDYQIYDEPQTFFKSFYPLNSKFYEDLLSNPVKFQPILIQFYELKPIRSMFKAKNVKINPENSSEIPLKSEKSSKHDFFLDSNNSENNKENYNDNEIFGINNEININCDTNNENPLGYVQKTRIKLTDERMNNNSGSFLKDLEKHLEELSFETAEFNIYDPNYSSAGSSLKDSLNLEKQKSSKEEKLKLLNGKFDENVFEFQFEDENDNIANLQMKSQKDEKFHKKLNLIKGASQSNTEKTIPLFLIKKALIAKPKDINNEPGKNLQIQAGLRRTNNNNNNQLHYKSLTSHPYYSSSFSNTNISKGFLEKNMDEEGEIDGNRKKIGLKEKIMEMNRIYTKKPIFSNKLPVFKEK